MCLLLSSLRALRRRLSALGRGKVLETSPTKIPPAAVGLGERLRHIIEIYRNRIIESTERRRPPSSGTRRSMDGDRLHFRPGDVIMPEENGEEAFSHHAGRGARGTLSLIGLFHHPATHHRRLGGTILRCKERRIKAAQPHAMTWELQRIYEFLDPRG
ncbi:hypothetical protein TcYC6_0015240 [Trypanosoma cruzi]|nr:hypothetical protein TcYC6_0015240 [Trypanosoma cruzi]